MSQLQLGLICVGAVFLLCVVAYNKWQERKVARSVSNAFSGQRPDVLMGAEPRREPTLGKVGDSFAEQEPAVAQPPVVEPSVEEELEPESDLEVVLELQFSQPVEGHLLVPSLQQFRQAGRKPIRVLAVRADGSNADVSPKESYVGLRLDVLLANRSGPLSAIEYSEVVTKLQSLADQFEGVVEFPEMDDVVARAAQLDRVATELDAMVGLVLNSRGGDWDGDLVAGAATRCGFVLSPDGRFHRVNEAGQTLFVLAHPRSLPYDATQISALRTPQLTLTLDVPCFAEQTTPFSHMAEVGQALADVLHADLVDDGGRPVTVESAFPIDAQLQALYTRLREANLAAGSARAQRLFS